MSKSKSEYCDLCFSYLYDCTCKPVYSIRGKWDKPILTNKGRWSGKEPNKLSLPRNKKEEKEEWIDVPSPYKDYRGNE